MIKVVLLVTLLAHHTFTAVRFKVGGLFCFLSRTYLLQLPGGVLPYKRLMGMCRWMGSHFHDWIDYNGVTFLVELLEWGRTFSGFLR